MTGVRSSYAWRIPSLYHEACKFPNLVIPGTRSNISSHEDSGPTRHICSDYAGQARRPRWGQGHNRGECSPQTSTAICASLHRKNAQTDHIRQIPLRLTDFIHDQSFSHHRCRRKLLGLAGTRTVTILPRSPPVAARRIRTRRHKHHDYRSNYRSIDLEVAHRALNNSCHLFLIPSPLDEKRSTRINIR
jgi:hypothetical protein